MKCWKLAAIFAFGIAMAADGADVTRDLPMVSTVGMEIPGQTVQLDYPVSESRGNFTSFDGVRDVSFEQGRLRFTLDRNTATIGWGNVLGKQPVGEIRPMLQQVNQVALRIRQAGKATDWEVEPWRDGKSLAGRELRGQKAFRAQLEGEDWQNLSFNPMTTGIAIPDGLEFTVRGRPGTVIEIEYLTLSHEVRKGYLRTEFDLPEGDIWRATANVVSRNLRHWYSHSEIASTLYINGEVVARQGANHLYHLAPVDVARYLKPGRNCIGFYGFRIGEYSPPLILDLQVVMADGEIITAQSGSHWKYAAQAEAGWNKPGLDDGNWQPVEEGAKVWLLARDFSHQLGLPHYLGPVRLKNPEGKWLFYDQDKPVVVSIALPAGLAEKKPTLHWSLGLADGAGRVEPADSGALATFAEADGSLVYRLNLGKRSHGVYALAVDVLDANGEILYRRSREPVVVLRALEQPEVEGRSYTQGMDLELETEIDFTDPDSPHSWHEFELRPGVNEAIGIEAPRIANRDGLTYREVSNLHYGSGFSYRLEFNHPGSLYLVEVDCPDNGFRLTEISMTSKIDGVRFSGQTSAGVETGGKFYTTGKMQTLRWIHRADHGPHSIDVMNGRSIYPLPAAAAGVRVYRIKGPLPALKAGSGRKYGIHNERQFYNNGFGRNFGMDMPVTRAMQKERDQSRPPMQSFLADLHWLKDAAELYTQYLRFSGQRTQALGCLQYSDNNTPYVPAPDAEVARVPWCPRSMLAHIFALNDIDFYAGIEWSQSPDVRNYVNNAQVARGAETYNFVDGDGGQRYASEIFTMVANWLHPEIEGAFLDIMRQVTDTFGHLSNYRGVHNLIGPSQWGSGYFAPAFGWSEEWNNPMAVSYDDITFARFKQDTGIKLPLEDDDPERFSKRASLLQNPAYRKRFLAWRTGLFNDFVQKSVNALREGRPDAELVNAMVLESADFFRYLHGQDRSFDSILRDFALDLGALNRLDGVSIGRWTVSWRHTNDRVFPHQDSYFWIAKESPEYIETFAGAVRRYVFCRTSWDENHIRSAGVGEVGEKEKGVSWGALVPGSDWIQNRAELTAMPQPAHIHARETLAQALITGDPNLVLSGFTDVHLNLGHEQAVRTLIRPYTYLPEEAFENVLDTGLRTNLAIRKLNRSADSWFYVVNPGYWPIRGTVRVKAGAPVYNPTTDTRVAGAGDADVPVDLPPYGLAIFKVDSPALDVTGFETEKMAGGEIDRLHQAVKRVLALLDDPQTKLALAGDDRPFMKDISDQASAALQEDNYALAWSLIKLPRYWTLWRNFLEKAAEQAAALPERLGAAQDATSLIEERPTLEAHPAAEPIVVDGRLDEAAWDDVLWSTGFWFSGGKPALAATGVKALYDDKNLYIAVACADRNPLRIKADAEDELQINARRDDQVAFFLQPDETVNLYYQMSFNPAGVRFDQRVRGGERDYEFEPNWNTATAAGEQVWITEVVFPYEAFGLKGKQDTWRINVFRRFRNDEINPSSWSWTSGNWHDLKRLGRLVFAP